MRIIIAGSRGITDCHVVGDAIADSKFVVTEVVSGTARGVDRLGEQWASRNRVPIKRFPAQWDKLGKRAGYVRNQEMAIYADALIAIWDGVSKGTKHMIRLAREEDIRVYVHMHRSLT